MDETTIACRWCGTKNRAGSTRCELCRNNLDALPEDHGFGLMQPALAYAGSVPATRTAIAPTSPHEITWGWHHLFFFSLFAFWIPAGIMAGGPTDSFSFFLDTSLLVQIVCYFLAAGLAFVLVHARHGGDWSTLGISLSDVSYREAWQGALFGLGLIMLWLPIGFQLTDGKWELDPMLQTLIGGTSSLGLVFAVIVVVVGAPIIEEIFFRGMLYARLSHRGRGAAIVGTSLLFVLAHGSLLIPSLLFVAFALGLMRQIRGLWFTICAHAMWNLVVLGMAAFVVLGGPKSFIPPDHAYSVEYNAAWDRVEELEFGTEIAVGMTFDLILAGPNGSVITIATVDLTQPAPGRVPAALRDGRAGKDDTAVGGSSDLDMELRSRIDKLQYLYEPLFFIVPSVPLSYRGEIGGESGGWEITNEMTDPAGAAGRIRKIAVLPDGWDEGLIFELMCPTASCADAAPDFEALLESVSFE